METGFTKSHKDKSGRRKAIATQDAITCKADLAYEVKLIRAHSGCLGTRRRRRTRLPAISGAELDVSFDAPISESGNRAGFKAGDLAALAREGRHPGN